MACLPCVVWPILLFIWYKFFHPLFMKFWNSRIICNERVNLTSESGENENNINTCYFDTMRNELLNVNTENRIKDE